MSSPARPCCPTLLTGIAAENARVRRLIPTCSLYLAAGPNHPYLERPFMWTDPGCFRDVVDLFLDKIVA